MTVMESERVTAVDKGHFLLEMNIKKQIEEELLKPVHEQPKQFNEKRAA